MFPEPFSPLHMFLNLSPHSYTVWAIFVILVAIAVVIPIYTYSQRTKKSDDAE